jgi:hypothetical protein
LRSTDATRYCGQVALRANVAYLPCTGLIAVHYRAKVDLSDEQANLFIKQNRRHGPIGHAGGCY